MSLSRQMGRYLCGARPFLPPDVVLPTPHAPLSFPPPATHVVAELQAGCSVAPAGQVLLPLLPSTPCSWLASAPLPLHRAPGSWAEMI